MFLNKTVLVNEKLNGEYYMKTQVIENHFYIVQNLKQKETFMQYFNINKLLHRSVGHE